MKFMKRYGTLIVENTERNSMTVPAIGEFLQDRYQGNAIIVSWYHHAIDYVIEFL